jgi:hypothetical protein
MEVRILEPIKEKRYIGDFVDNFHRMFEIYEDCNYGVDIIYLEKDIKKKYYVEIYVPLISKDFVKDYVNIKILTELRLKRLENGEGPDIDYRMVIGLLTNRSLSFRY